MVNCRACNSSINKSYIGKIAPFVSNRMLHGQQEEQVFECMSCGLVWINVNPSHEDMMRHYDGYWSNNYVTERERYEPSFKEKKSANFSVRNTDKYIDKFIKEYAGTPETILDLGGGSGIEAPFIGISNIDVFDISNVDVIPECKKVTSINKYYDLVVLSHILEHVPDPQGMLNQALSYCSNDGYVYIEIPDEASQYGKRPRYSNVSRLRGFWHEHIQYFDTTSITALVNTCGARVVSLEQRMLFSGDIIQVLVSSK